MEITLRYVSEDIDRHGNVRIYVRPPNAKKIRIREMPGTVAFTEACQAALAGARPAGAAKVGSFRALCTAYFGSAAFAALDKSTRSWRRRALDKIAETDGEYAVALIDAKAVRKLRDELSATPGAANTRVKALKALFVWAVDNEEIGHNPARDVGLISYRSDGHHPWTLEEIEQFAASHPIGTKARLAMALLLYTAGRREDAVRLGPQHMRGGRVRFTQAKNEHRSPVKVDLPQSPELAAIIAATPTGHMAFLVTEYGKPFSPAGFGNKMRQWCDEARLPQCSAHGLRKAAATRLADSGATAHEIMAVTGHRTLEEVERYTRAAAQSKLADSGMAKLEKITGSSHRGRVTSHWRPTC